MRERLVKILKELVELEENLLEKNSNTLKVIAREKYGELFSLLTRIYGTEEEK